MDSTIKATDCNNCVVCACQCLVKYIYTYIEYERRIGGTMEDTKDVKLTQVAMAILLVIYTVYNRNAAIVY